MSRRQGSRKITSAVIVPHTRRRRSVQERDNILATINTMNIFPPFIYDARRLGTLLNERTQQHQQRLRRRDYNGFDLCVVVVTEEVRRTTGVNDVYAIRAAANALWRRSSRVQKQDYIQLAQEINLNRR